MIEGIGSYEDIYSETLSKEDMANLDAYGIEWRGRNIYDMQDDLHLKIIEIVHRTLENTAQTNPKSLLKIKADLVELFQVIFAEDADDEDEPSTLLYRYDPRTETYLEVEGGNGKFKDTIKKTGKAIKKAGKKAGKAIKKGAQKVKDGAKKAAKKTAHWVKEHPVETGAILTAAAVVVFGPAGLAAAPTTAIPPSNDDHKRKDEDKKPKSSSSSSNVPPPPNPSSISAPWSPPLIPDPNSLANLTGHKFTYPSPTYTTSGSFNSTPAHLAGPIPQLHHYEPPRITEPTYHAALSNLPPSSVHYFPEETTSLVRSAVTPVFETSHPAQWTSNFDIKRPPIIETLIPSEKVHSPTQYHSLTSIIKDDHFSKSDSWSEIVKNPISPSTTASIVTEKPTGSFMKGFSEGAKKGAVDSVKELPANVLNIVKLAGHYTLDPFIHPLDHLLPGQELISQAMAIQETVSYLQNCDKAELFKTLAPEAAELVLNWDNLSQEERGRLSGYCVGKYGTDVLVPALGIKGAKAVANLAKGELAASSILQEAAAVAKFEKPTEAVIKEAGLLDASLESTKLAKNGVAFTKQTPVQEYLVSEGLPKDIKEIVQNTKIAMQSEAFVEGKALAEELQTVTGLTTQSKLDKIINLEKEISEWLGKDTRLIQNEAGDAVFISKDGLRRVRFDFNSLYPHNNPHSHVEIKINGEWVKSGPIYPTDVPHN